MTSQRNAIHGLGLAALRQSRGGMSGAVLCLAMAIAASVVFWSNLSLAAQVADEEPEFVDEIEPADTPRADELSDDKTDASSTEAPERGKKPARPTQPTTKKPASPPDVVASAVLSSNPQSPSELLQAVSTLSNLGRGDLATSFLDRLSATNLKPTQMADLADEIDGAALLRLADDRSLNDAGRAWIRRLAESAAQRRADARQLAAWTKQLGGDDAVARQRAARSLLLARRRAVSALVDVLVASPSETATGLATQILRQLGDDAVEPLVAISRFGPRSNRRVAIDVLGQLKARRAAAALVALSVATDEPLQPVAKRTLGAMIGSSPTPGEARILLANRIRSLLDESLLPESRQLESETWRWNAKSASAVADSVRADDAAIEEAAILASELLSLDADSNWSRVLFGVATLETAKRRFGLDDPIVGKTDPAVERVLQLGPDTVSDVLSASLATGCAGAAAGACELLASVGDEASLHRPPDQSAALIRAAAYPDRRVQVAALRAILGFQPQTSFAGASIVPDTLTFLAGATGKRQAIIAHPRLDLAQHLAGVLGQLDIEGLPATNGKQAMAYAAQHPDVEMIFVHMAIAKPDVAELVVQLRGDRRTAGIPLALIAIDGDERRAEQLVERIAREEPVARARWSAAGDADLSDARSLERLMRSAHRPAPPIVIRPDFDATVLRNQVESLDRVADRGRTSTQRREADARWALATMAHLSDKQRALFDLRPFAARLEESLIRQENAAAAPAILARLASPHAQQALADLASTPRNDLEARRAAAAAFSDSISRFGTLLSRRDIRRQYDLYNSSASDDEAAQQVLASILDAIERKRPEK